MMCKTDSTLLLCRRWFVILVVASGLTGCGSSEFASVSGKVVFPDKTPLKGGSVVFNPVDGGTHAAQGVIDASGSFQLGTNQAHDGVKPGKYNAAIEPEDRKDAQAVDSRFENPATSRLSFTVVPGANDFTIVVDGPKSKKKGT